MDVRYFPDVASYIKFLRGKSNEIKPVEAKKKKAKKKKEEEK